eukprot:15513945-Heterocapsa_arctica.AAC.1
MQCNTDAVQNTCSAAQCSAVQHSSPAPPEVGMLLARCYHVLQGGIVASAAKGGCERAVC